jgi:large subunit ribosomal protein L3
MVDINKPRRGSMGFRPRKRAATQNVSVNWLPVADKRIIGFAGYTVGMTHVANTDLTESPTKGQEVVSAATVLEVPPMVVYGVRCYDAARSIGDILTQDEKILKTLNFRKKKQPKAVNEADVKDVRLLAYCQPDKTLMGKKHVESMELGVGGKDAKEKLEAAKALIGKELRAKDVFKPGEFVDVAAVTIGKGWQGAVKRFGIAKQRPKSTGKRRHVGTLGQWHPAYVLYTVPQAGQMGYHTRTELNKQILAIRDAETAKSINPSSGFPDYGIVKNDYVLVMGSVPGPSKRLVKLRLASRAKTGKDPQIAYVSVEPR